MAEARPITGVTDLVASNLLRYVVEGLYYPQTELLPLLVLVDDDVFNVAHQAKIMYAISQDKRTESMNESTHTHTHTQSKHKKKLQQENSKPHIQQKGTQQLTTSSPQTHSPCRPLSPPRHTRPVCSTRPPSWPSNRTAPSTPPRRRRRRS